MALNGVICAEVPLRTYSLTHTDVIPERFCSDESRRGAISSVPTLPRGHESCGRSL